MQKITPFLWFDGKAEEATNFYVAIFKNSRILGVSRYGDAGPGPKGTVMTVAFELNGDKFVGLNGGPVFHFTEAVSFAITCETQDEVDHFWEKLSAGGQKSRCGWLKDRYGLSWQVVPSIIPKVATEGDPAKLQRLMAAVMKMDKLDIKTLESAVSGA